MGHTQPIKIVIIQKCPELQRIYGILLSRSVPAQRQEAGISETIACVACFSLVYMPSGKASGIISDPGCELSATLSRDICRTCAVLARMLAHYYTLCMHECMYVCMYILMYVCVCQCVCMTVCQCVHPCDQRLIN